MSPGGDDAVSLRAATEADHAALVAVVDEWWGGRRMARDLPRLWLRHFAGTSLVAVSGARIVGFLVGFVSQDDPELAVVHLVGVAPSRRREGIGRELVAQFAARAAARGAVRMTTIAWPADRVALAFLRAAGFRVDAGPGTQPLYGTPSHTNWNLEGDDRVVLDREI